MGKIRLRREKKKNEIIGTAAQLFLEKGFENVALSDIAEEIKMGRTTIYEYFENKNEIMATYLEKEMSAYHAKIRWLSSRRIS